MANNKKTSMKWTVQFNDGEGMDEMEYCPVVTFDTKKEAKIFAKKMNALLEKAFNEGLLSGSEWCIVTQNAASQEDFEKFINKQIDESR